MIAINDQLTLLELDMEFMGKQSIIYPLLIKDRQYRMLVDAGLPGQYAELSYQLQLAGTSPEWLDSVLLTHQDLDHIGCLPELDVANQYATFYAHAQDAPYIRGDIPLLKHNVVPWQSSLSVLPSGRVDRYVTDGQKFNIMSGIEVIHTPGHTSGHVCLLLEREHALVAGDLVFYIDEELVLPPVQLTENMPQSIASLHKLMQYDFDTLICYHGGICHDGKAQLQQLLDRLSIYHMNG
ncbi:MBL fold metallo-hydrolase [Paenibacillus sp. WLX1005]|uniref:MBL fold metallo-hydrolase n=1 Tax=Paenibacillus sp. WLX1005 TaxID=3243766 RepID=UPI00398447BA